MRTPADGIWCAGRPSPVPAFVLYGESPQTSGGFTLHVETIASRSRLHDWTIQPHRHRDLHQILMIRSGSAQVRLDHHASTLRGSGIVIVPPGCVHGYRFEVNTAGLVCSFARALAEDLSAGSPILGHFLERPMAASVPDEALAETDADRLSGMLLREFENAGLGREAALRGLLAAWAANLYRISRTAEYGAAAAGIRDREVVARFRRAIEQRFRDHASVADYCRVVGASESQLRRACLAVTGRPPAALVHLRLLLEAQRQLRYTAMPVTQIAYYLGFEDPAYFTRFFTRQSGSSPKAFRARAEFGEPPAHSGSE